jgi:hypothetical protein
MVVAAGFFVQTRGRRPFVILAAIEGAESILHAAFFVVRPEGEPVFFAIATEMLTMPS